MYQWHFEVIWNNVGMFLDGALVTVKLTIASFVLGVTLGLLVAFSRLSRWKLVRFTGTVFVELFRSTPALIQLVWIYYALPILTGIRLDAFTSIALGLGLHTAAYYGEIFRGGILSIDRGQMDAAKAVGMLQSQAMRRIIVPQAVRRMLPPFMNETASLIKLTALGSTFAVYEILYSANMLIVTTYRPLEVYTAAALLFMVIIYPVTYCSKLLESRWRVRS